MANGAGGLLIMARRQEKFTNAGEKMVMLGGMGPVWYTRGMGAKQKWTKELLVRGEGEHWVRVGKGVDELEIKVAKKLAKFFESDIEFIATTNTLKTPDLRVVKYNQYWEIKSARGNSKNTLHHLLAKASLQAENIVVTLYLTEMTTRQAISYLEIELMRLPKIKRLLVITKKGQIMEVPRARKRRGKFKY